MENGTCEYCGASLKLLRAGARFCSTKHRVYASRANKLPAEMLSRPRWIRRTSTKRPVTTSGRQASSTKSATWSTYTEAKASKAGVGLGFVLGEGIGCIDLDHCLIDGKLSSWAAAILDATPDTYIEVSQSGTGLHIFGHLPEGPGRVFRDGRDVEFYSVGRYIAVTGNRWENSPAKLADISGVVASIL
jgi:primase-polymerase (primpol)-like protein